jgi:protease I
MNIRLNRKRVAFLFADGVERAELLEPMSAVREAGGETVLISPKHGGVQIQMMDHGRESDLITTELATAEAAADDFDALVLPGGVENTDHLSDDRPSISLVQAFFTKGKPVGAVGRVGISWVNKEVRGHGALVTGRKQDDLPAFCDELVKQVSQTRGRQAIAL